MLARVVLALLSVLETVQTCPAPAEVPVWMVPVIVDGVPTTTVEPVLEASETTESAPVEERLTARADEPTGARLVRVPFRPIFVLTKALTGVAGVLRTKS